MFVPYMLHCMKRAAVQNPEKHAFRPPQNRDFAQLEGCTVWALMNDTLVTVKSCWLVVTQLPYLSHSTIQLVLPSPGYSWPRGWKSWAGVGKNSWRRVGKALKPMRSICQDHQARSQNNSYLRSRLSICAASTEHKESLMNNESINAENQANEITDWLNDLNVRQWELQFAYAVHILKRNSARSSFMQCKSRADLTKITWAIACEWACHKLSSWFTCFVHMLSICRRIFAAKSIRDICMICDCAVFSMFRSSRAYARLQYFALAVSWAHD